MFLRSHNASYDGTYSSANFRIIQKSGTGCAGSAHIAQKRPSTLAIVQAQQSTAVLMR